MTNGTAQPKKTTVNYVRLGLSLYLLSITIIVIYLIPYFKGKLVFIKYISYFLLGLIIFILIVTQNVNDKDGETPGHVSSIYVTVTVILLGFITSLIVSEDLADTLLDTIKASAEKAKDMVN